MNKIIITMADGSCYEKWFETEPLRDLFFCQARAPGGALYRPSPRREEGKAKPPLHPQDRI